MEQADQDVAKRLTTNLAFLNPEVYFPLTMQILLRNISIAAHDLSQSANIAYRHCEIFPLLRNVSIAAHDLSQSANIAYRHCEMCALLRTTFPNPRA